MHSYKWYSYYSAVQYSCAAWLLGGEIVNSKVNQVFSDNFRFLWQIHLGKCMMMDYKMNHKTANKRTGLEGTHVDESGASTHPAQ